MFLAFGPKRLPQRALTHRIRIDLVTQISGIADPLDDAITHANRHALYVHELEALGRNVISSNRAQHITSTRACNLKTGALIRNILKTDAVVKIVPEPSFVNGLIAI